MKKYHVLMVPPGGGERQGEPGTGRGGWRGARTTSGGTIAECPFKPGDCVKFLEYAPTEIKVRTAQQLIQLVACAFHSFVSLQKFNASLFPICA